MPPKSLEGQPRVQWQSVRWPDNSTYEGLVKDDKCHVRGVFKYSNGDRYEGEFQENNMSGYGVYVWGAEGSVYRGHWRGSMMDGCGVKITRQPNGAFLAEEGEFVNDEWVGSVMACTLDQARGAAAEADVAAQMARVFELGGTNGDPAAALAKAQAAAAAAAAEGAQPAKLRRRQRQQQQRPQADLPVGAGAAGAAAMPLPAAKSARQWQQDPLSAVQGLAQSVQQAAQHAAQQAVQRFGALTGQRRQQQAQ